MMLIKHEGDDEEDDRLDRPHLPESVVHVWLRGKGIATDADGSHLVVMLFHEGADLSIREIVEPRLRQLDWEGHAKDWRYEEVFPWFFGLGLEDEDETAG